MKSKVLRKTILSCMIVTILALGLGAVTFAQVVEVPPADMYPEKQMAFDWLDQPRIFEKYGKMSDTIWSYAELGMQEFVSSKLLADNLEKEGFKVERGMAGMPTCFVASYGSGKPVIGYLCEYDALPMVSNEGRVPRQEPLFAIGDEVGPGHGCGHNAQGPAASAAAIAVKQAIDRYGLKGTIKVFGSPAEETLVSRPYMVRAGLFDGVDAVLSNHTGSSFGGGTLGGRSASALFSTVFSFKGVTAHGASPWGGKSALDAVEIMNVSVNYLREHLYFSYRIHYVIPSGGEAPNVVPDYASVWYFNRNSDERIEGDYEKIINCAKGAALGTGTELSIRVLTAIHQVHNNASLTKLVHQNSMLIGVPEWSDEEQAFAKAIQKARGARETGLPTKLGTLREHDPTKVFTGSYSTDTAEVSWVTALAGVRIPKGGAAGGGESGKGHHWASTASTYGSTVWKGINVCAKGMAGVTLDLMTKPELLKDIRDDHAANVKQYGPWKSYLPPDAEPPNDLNRGYMQTWRPVTEEFYIEWPY